MRKILFVLLLSTSQIIVFAQQVRLATFNVRGDLARDAPANMWKDRVAMVNSLITFHNFDVLGVQEGLPNQLEDMNKGLPAYTLVADNSYNGINSSAIFFKKEIFDLVKSGSFWLAPNPADVVKAWDAKYPRSCTWVLLKHKESGTTFSYFNTHLDHVGLEARKQSVLLIAKKIKELSGNNPAAVGGDFNFSQFDDNYTRIQSTSFLTDAFQISPVKHLPNGTFNGFNITRNSIERIDHIFVTQNVGVIRYGILTDNFGGKFPSDHFPVLIDVIFKK